MSEVWWNSHVVWSSNLTSKNIRELERVQKVAINLIANNKKTYKENLKHLNIETLTEWRDILSKRFADKCTKNPKTKDMFIHKTKEHKMKLRKENQYQVQKINTVRMQKSAIPQMTKYLNIKNKQRTANQRTKEN